MIDNPEFKNKRRSIIDSQYKEQSLSSSPMNSDMNYLSDCQSPIFNRNKGGKINNHMIPQKIPLSSAVFPNKDSVVSV